MLPIVFCSVGVVSIDDLDPIDGADDDIGSVGSSDLGRGACVLIDDHNKGRVKADVGRVGLRAKVDGMPMQHAGRDMDALS